MYMGGSTVITLLEWTVLADGRAYVMLISPIFPSDLQRPVLDRSGLCCFSLCRYIRGDHCKRLSSVSMELSELTIKSMYKH